MKKDSYQLAAQICTGVLFAAGIVVAFYFLSVLIYVFGS